MDLARHELTPRGHVGRQPPPLTWDYAGARNPFGLDLALVTCRFGHVTRLTAAVHRVAPDGTVSPSYVCTVGGCTFHAFVRLAGWDPAGAVRP